MNDTILEVQDLDKGYRTSGEHLEVLRGLDMIVRRGEVVAIVGASGVGKSTLLHVLGGLDRADGGEVKVTLDSGGEARDLSAMSESALNRFRNEHVGFVFQFHHLLSEFNALENVLLPALVRGDTIEQAREKARRLLAEVGLAERLHHRPAQLSGGEAQRVAIARALVNDPQMLLMDEPTGNLDRSRSDRIFDLVDSIHTARGLTTIVVTHDREIAARAKQIFILAGGRLATESSAGPS